MPDKATDREILTLHRYFISANRMKKHFEELTPTVSRDKLDSFIEPMIYMSFWYAGLFVVIEGWRELGLPDARIDNLLQSPNVDLLRRYRNGAFHFQREYFDARFLDFVKEPGTVQWVRELNENFGRWFLERPK